MRELYKAALFFPFIGWFVGLPAALRESDFTPYFYTWVLTMPFVGFLALIWLVRGTY